MSTGVVKRDSQTTYAMNNKNNRRAIQSTRFVSYDKNKYFSEIKPSIRIRR